MIRSVGRIIVVVVISVMVHGSGFAQDTIPFVPSPIHVVHKMIEAAKKFGIRGVGIDLNPELVAKARENAEKEGVSHLVEFRAQDGLTVDISEATVVTLYMFKWFNNALKPKLQKLKPGARIVAHDFDIDDWKPTRIEYVTRPADDSSDYAESRTLYIWIVGEAPAMP